MSTACATNWTPEEGGVVAALLADEDAVAAEGRAAAGRAGAEEARLPRLLSSARER